MNDPTIRYNCWDMMFHHSLLKELVILGLYRSSTSVFELNLKQMVVISDVKVVLLLETEKSY